jgi:PPM family protein phosphatase
MKGDITLMWKNSLNFAACTEGYSHANSSNEDSLLMFVPRKGYNQIHDGSLFVVADGFGSIEVGAPSQVATHEVFIAYYEYRRQQYKMIVEGSMPDGLEYAMKQANTKICQRNEEWRTQGGSTCTAVVLCREMLYGASTGHSRAYLIRQGKAKQLSEDQTPSADDVRAGKLTPEQARSDDRRHILYDALGHKGMEVHTFTETMQDGDYVLLCTTGLTESVEDHEISAIVRQYELQESVNHLTRIARERSDRDDITVVLVKVALYEEERRDDS